MSPVSQVRPLNQVQKISGTRVIDRVVVQPHTWYTCPTGKKAIVTGRFRCDNSGAATEVRVEVNGVQVIEWDATTVNAILGVDSTTNSASIKKSVVGQYSTIDVTLEAGDTVETTQNIGTNASVNGELNIKEVPA